MASSSLLSFENVSTLNSAILVCNNGLLRKCKRSQITGGTWISWKKRSFVLLTEVPLGLIRDSIRTISSSSTGANNSNDNNHQLIEVFLNNVTDNNRHYWMATADDASSYITQPTSSSTAKTPLLLIYETDNSSYPMSMIRIVSNLYVNQEDDTEDNMTSTSINMFEDHTKHVEINVSTVLSSSEEEEAKEEDHHRQQRYASQNRIFIDSDTCREIHHNNDADNNSISTGNHSRITTVAWRLKFPNDTTARLWRDTLREMVSRLPPPPPPQVGSPPAGRSREEGDVSDEALATLNENVIAMRNRFHRLFWRLQVYAIPMLVFFLFYDFHPDSGGYHQEDEKYDAISQATLLFQNNTNADYYTNGVILHNKNNHREAALQAFHGLFVKMINAAWQIIIEVISPLKHYHAGGYDGGSNRPIVVAELTALRRALSFLRLWKGLSQEGLLPLFFAGDTGTHSYYANYYTWVIILVLVPAWVVSVISITSIINQLLPPWLGRVIWRIKFIPFIILLLTTGILLAHDTYINHWKHPLQFGLYWYGCVEILIMFGCIGASFVLTKRTLQCRRRRIILSPARKCAAALSLFVAMMSFPLTLRYFEEREIMSLSFEGLTTGSTGIRFAMAAFVCLFSGLHFFGRAARPIIIGDVPIGERIYQLSHTPANTAYYILALLGDGCSYTVGKLIEKAQKIEKRATRLWTSNIYQILKAFVERLIVPTCKCLSKTIYYLYRKYCGMIKAVVVKVFLVAQRSVIPAFRDALRKAHRALTMLWRYTRYALELVYRNANRLAGLTFDLVVQFIEKAMAIWHFLFENALHPMYIGMFRGILMIINTMSKLMDTLYILDQKLYQSAATTYQFLVNYVVCPIGRFMYNHAVCPIRSGIFQSMLMLFNATSKFVNALYNLGQKLYELIVFISQLLIDHVLRPTARMIYRCVVMTITRCKMIWSYHMYPVIQYAGLHVSNAIVAIVSAFLKKYWQLIPAGLVFNGSLLLAGAALTATNDNKAELMISKIEYALGSYSLFLIGCTVLHTVITSQGNLVNQHVILKDSILQYVDLHLLYALKRIVHSGWHGLSTTLRLILGSCDYVIRNTFRNLWNILTLFYEHILKPIFRSSKSLLQSIWESPYISLLLSLGTIGLVYISLTSSMGTTIFRWIGWTYSLYDFFKIQGLQVINNFIVKATSMVDPSNFATVVAARNIAYENIYNNNPLININISSPIVGLCCWIFTCLVTKTRSRVRIKTFAVPILIIYGTSVAATNLLWAAIIVTIIWFVMSLFVDLYEQQEQSRVRRAFESFRRNLHHHGHDHGNHDRPSSNITTTISPATPSSSSSTTTAATALPEESNTSLPPPSSCLVISNVHNDDNINDKHTTKFEQDECPICLDEFKQQCGRNLQLITELPCGHVFHRSCIDNWLQEETRCPICRRAATNGFDRIIEVIF